MYKLEYSKGILIKSSANLGGTCAMFIKMPTGMGRLAGAWFCLSGPM